MADQSRSSARKAPPLHSITIVLAIFAALNVFGIPLAIRVLAPPDFRATSLDSTFGFVRRVAANDSWEPMKRALDQTRASPGTPLYQAVFFRDQTKFQYPPSSLLIMDLFDWLSRGRINFRILTGISWISILVLAFFLVPAIYIRALRQFSPLTAGTFNMGDWIIQVVVLVLLTLTFYPLMRGFALGQIQTWLTCAFAGSVLAWLSGYEAVAGVLIGCIASVKPQLAALLLWGLIHRRYRFFIGSAATLSGLESLSLWRYGLVNQLDYLSVLKFMSAHGESYYPNQSINGLLTRMLHIGNNITWQSHSFAPFHPVVYYGTLATSLFMIAFALFWNFRNRDEKATLISFLTASLLLTMASPIAWEHHYGIMTSIYTVILAILLAGHSRRIWMAGLGLSYVLASNCFLFTNSAADTFWNFVQTYLFAAAVLLVLIVYLSSRELKQPLQSPAKARSPQPGWRGLRTRR